MTTTHDLANYALEVPQEILEESGYALYSAADSLMPCPTWLSDRNPCGSLNDQSQASVRPRIEALPYRKVLKNLVVKIC